MKMEAEIQEMGSQAKECLGPPEARRHEEGSSPRVSGRSPAMLKPCCLPVNLSSLCLKPQRLGSSMPAREKVNLA